MSDTYLDTLISLIPRLRRFARSLAQDDERADDLVQDTIERALSRRDQWREGTSLESWLFRILRNRWIDVWRSAQSRAETMDLDCLAPVAGSDGREEYESVRQRAAIRDAVDSLPEGNREAVALVMIEGLDYREAAEVMGVSEGTVASRLSRARAALMERLGPVLERTG